MWIKIISILAVAWILQGVLTYFQIKNFQAKLAEFRKYSRLGVGTVKGRFSKGTIVILGVDDKDTIVDAQIMSGITVFARLRPFCKLKSKKIREISKITKGMNINTIRAINRAIDSLESSTKKEKGGEVNNLL
ncbi:MAG: transcriptional regulator GutM [Tepidanaerobacteraceae bacterium]|jgi:glucitol operon activator protein|nr:transcriptional regulator [Thermoanaerobacterales bacterium]